MLCTCIVLLLEQTKLLYYIEFNVPVLDGGQEILSFEAQFRLFSWKIVAV